MAKLSVDQALIKAKSHKKKGEIVEAQLLLKAVLLSFPKNKRAQKELIALNRQTRPNVPANLPKQEVDHLLDLYKQGQMLEVLKKTQVLAEQYSREIILWNLMGAAAAQTGQLDRAAFAFHKAINIKPNNPEIYNNIGNVFFEQKKLHDAEAAYLKAISIKPNYANAHCNLGNCLVDQGRLAEALKAYNSALIIRPNYPEAYNNMGVALKGNAFDKADFSIHNIIVALLDQKIYARPEYVAAAGISLLRLEPTLKKQLAGCHIDDLRINLVEVISELNKYPLLLKLMSVCPIADLDFEKLFLNLRRALLSLVSTSKVPQGILKFQRALALQCFTNEYVYEEGNDEKKSVEALEQAVRDAFKNNEQPRPETILALASYRPLNQFTWSNSLRVTNEIREVFTRQIDEPNRETELKEKIFVLEAIRDKVSSKVRQQYEASPYPRWVNLSLRLKPAPISGVIDEINLKLFNNKIREVEAPNILVAGCGTGQHSIGTAKRFKDSKVLAIDLSLSSLAYAKRKTDELMIENIEYMQADILDLGQLDKQFDIVESCGVLHHMDNPMAGWRALTNCLKPGGLMNIGLYSQLARQDIVKVREEICELNTGLNLKEMKTFRHTLIESDKYHHKSIRNITDFYTLSTLRDLLFHVQEHRFTVPEIKNCLQNLGLKFCGFEGAELISKFKQFNGNEANIYDLDKWQAYEQANPYAFIEMYRFWCQKDK